MSPPEDDSTAVREYLKSGRGVLGIELGSTRIKACLIGTEHMPIAVGSSEWENQFLDGFWTYSLKDMWAGVQACMANLSDNAQNRHGIRPSQFAGIGVSAMMHGYLAFGADNELLTPFRTWRNTGTGAAAAALTSLFGVNIPHRWSIAHLYQAILDQEPHVRRVAHLTTLAGYVHWQLTGRRVLGVGDASGMFPVELAACAYNPQMLTQFDHLVGARQPGLRIESVLPDVLLAGQEAGVLTAQGAALLDPTGRLDAGAPLCPPEGDAGTGMAATNSVAPRSGNVSVGTSIFAMVVLEEPLAATHPEVDVVATPAGEPVAMVHCNNGASELGAWANLLGEIATALGHPTDINNIYTAFMEAALDGDADGGGLLAYNYLSGEPVTGVDEGRPMIVRGPESRLTLANFARAQLYTVFSTLAIGMNVLTEEGVELDSVLAHGGLFRTPGAAQRILAAAIDTPVAVGQSAAEGGAWGAALLAAYLTAAPVQDLTAFLRDSVFRNTDHLTAHPDPNEVAGFNGYLKQFRTALPLQRTAVDLTAETPSKGADAAAKVVSSEAHT